LTSAGLSSSEDSEVLEADCAGESKGELLARVEAAESEVMFLLSAGCCGRAVVVAIV
jgi:uncharacterized protein (DUF779 family)